MTVRKFLLQKNSKYDIVSWVEAVYAIALNWLLKLVSFLHLTNKNNKWTLDIWNLDFSNLTEVG